MQAAVARTGTWELQVVRRCDRHRFVVLPKRWIVERTLAWISRCRRLARDYERHARKAAAFVRLAMIRLMPHIIARSLVARINPHWFRRRVLQAHGRLGLAAVTRPESATTAPTRTRVPPAGNRSRREMRVAGQLRSRTR